MMIKKIGFVIILAIAFIQNILATEIEKFDPKKMKVSLAGIKLIARFEGFQDSIYECPAGKSTIGFGHVVETSETNNYLNKLSLKEGLTLLNSDIVDRYEPDIQRLVTIPLEQGQFDALTSFDYNLGAKNLGNSTLLQHLNAADVHQASLQFPLWRKAAGQYLPGLFKRRLAEMFIFRGDDKIPEDLGTIPTSLPGETLLMVYQNLAPALQREAQDIYLEYKANSR
jgi:lysozyme